MPDAQVAEYPLPEGFLAEQDRQHRLAEAPFSLGVWIATWVRANAWVAASVLRHSVDRGSVVPAAANTVLVPGAARAGIAKLVEGAVPIEEVVLLACVIAPVSLSRLLEVEPDRDNCRSPTTIGTQRLHDAVPGLPAGLSRMSKPELRKHVEGKLAAALDDRTGESAVGAWPGRDQVDEGCEILRAYWTLRLADAAPEPRHKRQEPEAPGRAALLQVRAARLCSQSMTPREVQELAIGLGLKHCPPTVMTPADLARLVRESGVGDRCESDSIRHALGGREGERYWRIRFIANFALLPRKQGKHRRFDRVRALRAAEVMRSEDGAVVPSDEILSALDAAL